MCACYAFGKNLPFFVGYLSSCTVYITLHAGVRSSVCIFQYTTTSQFCSCCMALVWGDLKKIIFVLCFFFLEDESVCSYVVCLCYALVLSRVVFSFYRVFYNLVLLCCFGCTLRVCAVYGA